MQQVHTRLHYKLLINKKKVDFLCPFSRALISDLSSIQWFFNYLYPDDSDHDVENEIRNENTKFSVQNDENNGAEPPSEVKGNFCMLFVFCIQVLSFNYGLQF